MGDVTGYVALLHGGPNDGERVRVPDPPPEEWKVPIRPDPVATDSEATRPHDLGIRAAVYRLVRHDRPPDPERTQNPGASVTVYCYDGMVGST